MFLTSFFKKKQAISESPPSTSPQKNAIVDVQHVTSLPSWKDTASWTADHLQPDAELQCRELQDHLYDVLKTVRDPEKPESLGELNVVTEDSVQVRPIDGGFEVRIDFNPTVPHCSLASLIGLCLRKKALALTEGERVKLDIVIAEGKHSTGEEISKQINDKERVAAAMENPSLREIVENCIAEG